MQNADFGLIHAWPFSWATGGFWRFLHVFFVGLLVVGLVVVALGEVSARVWTLPELVRGAELVALGRVASKSVTYLAEAGIQTTVELEVESVWKGSVKSTNSISFYLPGGVLGERKVVVTGQPEFALEESCVVFLKRGEDGRWVLVGFGQGKLSVDDFKRRAVGLNSELP